MSLEYYSSTITKKCAWEGCQNGAGKGKYCPSCAKVAREKMKAIFAKSAEERENREATWKALYDKAHAAGMAALEAARPMPMVVQERQSPLDDASPVKKEWFVEGGVCGFAWVTIQPANCSFAIWLRKNTQASRGYYGGMQLWVHEGGQSMQRKEAYASAFAKVCAEAGIKAYMGSRMD